MRDGPAFGAQVFGPKRHATALVIPVINEGQRIRAQLAAIRAASPAVDIIIADGGSTDGSLDSAVLAEGGVRALLIKTGPGRLGTQLRMAYAWCLDQGYAGIVTMDGNGKDGPEAIPAFITALEAGYGYVQGSRYVTGGVARHTPWDRMLAGRLVHAPLLSLAGRRWLTDTTNGFRAYAAAYLADSRVDPFRPVFDGYALLFYLTVRAGQLGYRVCEIPVTRIYPATGRTPTKISGLRGRAAMLLELWGVVRGRFHPARQPAVVPAPGPPR